MTSSPEGSGESRIYGEGEGSFSSFSSLLLSFSSFSSLPSSSSHSRLEFARGAWGFNGQHGGGVGGHLPPHWIHRCPRALKILGSTLMNASVEV
jgi:hypothetical protein